MCLKVNPVNLLVKVHLVLSFAPVFSMVYPDINKINYSPFKRQTLQEWYLGQDVMNIERFSLVVKPKPKPKPIPFDSQAKWKPLYLTNTPENTESWPPRESRIVFKCPLITYYKALHTVFRLPLIFRLPYKKALRSASTNTLKIPTRNRQ